MIKNIFLLTLLNLLSFVTFSQTFLVNGADQTVCAGTFSDGAGSYANDMLETITFCPSTAGAKVKMNFTAFDTELNYDFLTIYDGNSTTAPVLGVQDGTSLQGITIQASASNTTGCLTFVWDSDGSTVSTGWAATISCTVPCATPTAGGVFTNQIAPVMVCKNEAINFSGASSTAAAGFSISSYLWNFDDGTTGAGSIVSHSYPNPGQYVVNLDVTDNNGCHNTNHIDLVVQVSTVPRFVGTTLSQTICTGQNLCLNGVVTPTAWHDVPPLIVSGTTPLPDGSGVCYTNPLTFTEFGAGQTITNANQIQNFYASIEHDFAGDLTIFIICPNGQQAGLFNSDGTFCTTNISSEHFGNPVTSVGSTYTWTSTGTTMDAWAGANSTATTISAGTYGSEQPYTNLVGCPLNGTWTFKVCDTHTIDDGTVFNWGINFDPSIYGTLPGFTPVFNPNSTFTYWGGNNPASTAAITSTSANADQICITPTAVGPLSYKYTGVDNFGCTFDTTITITVIGLVADTAKVNVSCFGGANGTATVTVTSPASGPYTYDWSTAPPVTSALATNSIGSLAAGVYSVTITNASGCTLVKTITVTQPPAMTLIATPTNATCGGANGSISVAVTGGVAPYTFTCTGQPNITGTSPQVFPNLSVNPTYTLTATSSVGGCSATTTSAITSTGSVTASFTYNGNHCAGTVPFVFNNTGTTAGTTFAWTFAGGTPASSALVSGPAGGVTFTPAGTHAVTLVTTQGTCTSTTTVNVTANPIPVLTASAVNVDCFAAANGSASVLASGGTGFTYSWNTTPVQTTPSISNLAPGSYKVVVTNLEGCKDSSTVTVTQPAVLNLVVTRTNITCFGLNNGTANVSVTGGIDPPGATPPSYSYAWSGGATPTAASLANLGIGTYTVTVTDLNSPLCQKTGTVTISQPLDIILNITTTPAACGNSAGTASVAVTGSFPPFTYNWSAGTTPALSNTGGLSSTSYNVTVTDAQNCPKVGVANVGSVGGPTASITASTNVNCNGQFTGSATVTPVGGTAPLTYLWDAGTAPLNQPTINGLGAGMHIVTITDASPCTITASILITEPTALTVNASATSANCGQATGSITASINGGSIPYLCQWYSDAALTTLVGTATIINNRPAGTYYVKITDNKGCVANASAIVANIPGVSVTVKNTVMPSCFGGSNGSAFIEAANGTAGYIFICSSGDTVVTSSLTTTITGLSAGIYTITVTDLNNCQADTIFTITQPTPVVASISGSTNVSCLNGIDGTATVAGSGGTGPYTAIWASVPSQSSLLATGLPAGTYSVILNDSKNCPDTATVVITEPPTITLVTNKTNAHCGNPDGTASVVASGGTVTTGYTYTWSGGANPTLANNTDLSPNSYTVTVTDNKGCSATASVTVGNISPGTATISSFTNVTCNGFANGTAISSMGGGVGPYTYVWNTTPAQSTSTAVNLGPGTFTVNVTDANLCVVSAMVTITEPAAITNTFTVTNVRCYGQCDGKIASLVTGGTPPYTHQWSNLQVGTPVLNLCVGPYTLSVIDSHNCMQTYTTTVTEPTQIVIIGIATNAHCNQNDGGVDISVSGGSGGFTYLWSNGQTSQDLINATAGSYNVVVTDQPGCPANNNFSVNNVSGPVAVISASQNISCFGANDGLATVTATPTGGMPPIFTYAWNTVPAQQTSSATNLTPGFYTVTVTDTSGCTVNASVTIVEPSVLSAQNFTQNPSCFGLCNGEASVIPMGGTQPYTYFWPAGGANPTDSLNTTMCAGSYTVITTDAHNCTIMQNVTLTQPAFMTATTVATPLTCNGFCNGTTTVNANGGTLPYSFLWSTNANAQTTQIASGLCPGTFQVTVTDSHNCFTTSSATVTTPPVLLVQLATPIKDVNCFGQSTGRIIINAVGGSPGYSFLWSNGATTQNLINIPYGNYCVTVTDNNSCTYDTCFIVNQPPLLLVSTTSYNETCSGLNDGIITSNVIGGQQPYAYLWSNLTGQPIADSLAPGNYGLTITDFNNCQVSSLDTIVGHQILDVLIISTVMSTCGFSNGSAQISAIGGSGSFTYQWPANVSISSFADSLAAGAYTVTVVDANACRDSIQINISNITGPTIDNIVPTNVSCFGYSDGQLQVNYHPVAVTDSIMWNTSPVQLGNIATGLSPGSYSVVVKDSNGCIASSFKPITQPQLMQSAITSHTNLTCFGVCNGNATVMVSGGTQPYGILWSPSGATTSTASSLCAGIHQVTITDAHACSSTNTVTITQPALIVINNSVTNVSCNGQNNGQIALTVSGGTGYVYTWFPPVSTNAVAAPLQPGPYSVVVSDYNDFNCTKTASFVITEPDSIKATTGTIPTTCGLSNGLAFISSPIQGGTSPYTYHWIPTNSTNDTVYNASEGTHVLQVTDTHSCLYTTTAVVGAKTPPVIKSIVPTNISCNGFTDGKALITVLGGSQPYSYAWSPFTGNDSIVSSTSALIYGLNAGTYVVTISDFDNCTVNSVFIITQPTKVTIHANGNQWVCIGQQATITANASGGYAPYSYNWIGIDSLHQTQLVTPSATTTYYVIAEDSRGCGSDTTSVKVSVYPPINVQVFADDTAICKGFPDTLRVVTTGGNGQNYNWIWEDLSDTLSDPIRVVFPTDTTTYYVRGTDNCGSPSNTDSVTVIVYPLPFVQISVNKTAGCEPLEVYFHNVQIDSLFTYSWNFGDTHNNTTSDVNPSHEFKDDGIYTVNLTVTTNKNCSVSDQQIITVYPNPDARFDAYSDRDNTPNIASLFHPTMQFEDKSTENIASRRWNFGDGRGSGVEKPLHSYETAGVYDVWLYVKTDKGCIDSVKHPITILDEFTLYVPSAFAPNSPTNREFYPQGKGLDEKNYHFWIFDRWGAVLFETQDFNEHWNGRLNNIGDEIKSGTYAYYIWVKDTFGKSHEKSGPVTIIR